MQIVIQIFQTDVKQFWEQIQIVLRVEIIAQLWHRFVKTGFVF